MDNKSTLCLPFCSILLDGINFEATLEMVIRIVEINSSYEIDQEIFARWNYLKAIEKGNPWILIYVQIPTS